jgi:cell division protein FtsB
MRFILKQLQLFFPFVFPLSIGFPGLAGGLMEVQGETIDLLVALKKQVEELTARNKELEERMKKLEEEKRAQDEINEKFAWFLCLEKSSWQTPSG